LASSSTSSTFGAETFFFGLADFFVDASPFGVLGALSFVTFGVFFG